MKKVKSKKQVKSKKKENGDNMNELQWNVLRVSRSTQEQFRDPQTGDWFRKEQVWNCEKAGTMESGFKEKKRRKSGIRKNCKNCKKSVDIFSVG